MKLYRIVDKAKNYTSLWVSDYSLIQSNLDGYRWCFDDYKDKDRIFVESVIIPDDIEPELEEAYEWNKNKLTTITKNIY